MQPQGPYVFWHSTLSGLPFTWFSSSLLPLSSIDQYSWREIIGKWGGNLCLCRVGTRRKPRIEPFLIRNRNCKSYFMFLKKMYLEITTGLMSANASLLGLTWLNNRNRKGIVTLSGKFTQINTEYLLFFFCIKNEIFVVVGLWMCQLRVNY